MPAKSTPAKATPAKAAPAKKSTTPAAKKSTPSRAAKAAAAAATKTSPAPVAEVVDNSTDAALGDIAKQAKALRGEGLTVAEVATRLGVSASIARELCEGTPVVKPAKARGSATTRRTRVENASVTVTGPEQTVTCRTCSTEKAARQFPTISGPLHRGTECRACRDARRDAATDVRVAEAVAATRK